MRKGKLSRSDGSELRSPLELKVSCQCRFCSDGVLRPPSTDEAFHQRPLGVVACCPLFLLTSALLMTSSHSEGHITSLHDINMVSLCSVVPPPLLSRCVVTSPLCGHKGALSRLICSRNRLPLRFVSATHSNPPLAPPPCRLTLSESNFRLRVHSLCKTGQSEELQTAEPNGRESVRSALERVERFRPFISLEPAGGKQYKQSMSETNDFIT